MEMFENVFIRKVLVEKYSRAFMIKWITKQKNDSVKKLDFENAARWRTVEIGFPIDVKYYTSEILYKIDGEFFELFELIK